MPVGDFKEDSFDKDELAALGEADEKAPDAEKDEQDDDKGPDTQDEKQDEGDKTANPDESDKTEQTDEEKEQQKQAEELGLEVVTDEKTGKQYVIDEDGARIPPTRFKEIFWKAKEGERTKEKLDLFKRLGPEGYYQVYPDERPAQAPQPRQPQAPMQDLGAMKVVHPNGPYDGMTLREVYDIDPVFAPNLQTNFLMQHQQEETRRAGQQERVKADAAQELESFGESIAQASFKKAGKDCTKEEIAKVSDTIKEVIEFMNKTGRGGGYIADAYWLMNKEGLLKTVMSRTAENTLKSLTNQKAPASIDTSGGGNSKPSGFESYEKMSEAALTKVIEDMSEKDFKKFLKEAPKSLRTKYPSIF